MRYLIGIVFAALTFGLLLIDIKLGMLMWGDPSWILVALGVYPSTVVSALVTSVAFQAAKEYENLP